MPPRAVLLAATAATICVLPPAAAHAGSQDAAQAPAPRVVTVHRDVPSPYGMMVKLTLPPFGDVRVVARRTNAVSIDARVEMTVASDADAQLLQSAVGILVDPTPTSIEVMTKGPHDKNWMKQFKKFPDRLKQVPWRVDYTVAVPEYTSLTLEVGKGESVVEGVNGIISVVSLVGDIRVRNVAGSTRLTAYGGKIEILTDQRTWRGGNLTASATGDVTVVAPRGFSAELRLTAQGGIFIRGATEFEPGKTFDGPIGNGGPSIQLTSGGRTTIVDGAP